MRHNMIETLIGAVVLAVAVIFLAFAYSSAGFRSAAGYEVTAAFNTVGGIKVGSDVRISGIPVGTVTGLALDPDTFNAMVSMTIDKTYQLPEDSSATVSVEGLLGGNFIELVPGGSPGMIEPGGRIEYTEDSVDIMRMLGSFIFSSADRSE